MGYFRNTVGKERILIMDTSPAKRIGAIILAILCAWVIADFLSRAIARMLGLHDTVLYLASFILYAVIFLLVLMGIQKVLGVFIFDTGRLE